MTDWWRDLSSAELRARISQRHPHMSDHQVALVVAHRDLPDVARRIDLLLGVVENTRPL